MGRECLLTPKAEVRSGHTLCPYLSAPRSLAILDDVLLIENASSGLVSDCGRVVRSHVGSVLAREQKGLSGGMGGHDRLQSRLAVA
jgi:hypothetical protein